MTSHTAPLGPDGDTVALEKAAELDDYYAAQDLSSSTVSSRKGGAEAAVAGQEKKLGFAATVATLTTWCTSCGSASQCVRSRRCVSAT